MPSPLKAWAPALVVVTGIGLLYGVDRQRDMPLAAPLDTAVPADVDGSPGTPVILSEAERVAAGVDDYVFRDYPIADSAMASVYIGYYGQQTQGHTIHSPKNCLPGGGWDAVNAQVAMVATDDGEVPVNRYLLQRKAERVLVLYWYQGRGRVTADEYLVKWQLLRDAALRGRTEEALVRVVVPITSDEAAAFAVAERIARTIIPMLGSVLPA